MVLPLFRRPGTGVVVEGSTGDFGMQAARLASLPLQAKPSVVGIELKGLPFISTGVAGILRDLERGS